jgi:hypothetical protein
MADETRLEMVQFNVNRVRPRGRGLEEVSSSGRLFRKAGRDCV